KSSNYSAQSILRSGLAGTAALYLFFKKNKSLSYAKNYKLMMRLFSGLEYIMRRLLLFFQSRNKNFIAFKAKAEVYKKIFYWRLTLIK
ncbi:hypothetical protein KJ713_01135, partial [Patescibacteria group bacterium]|nr:hypothetical protein [Patescibacteria group bacterium]